MSFLVTGKNGSVEPYNKNKTLARIKEIVEGTGNTLTPTQYDSINRRTESKLRYLFLKTVSHKTVEHMIIKSIIHENRKLFRPLLSV